MNVDPRFVKKTGRETQPRRRAPASGTAPPRFNAFSILLQIEGDVRAVPDEQALHYFISNEIVKLTPGREAIVMIPGWRGSVLKPVAATGISKPDANAPAMAALVEATQTWLANTPNLSDAGVGSTHQFKATGSSAPPMPMRDVTLLRIHAPSDRDTLLGAIVLLGANPVDPELMPVLERVTGAFGHALSFFVERKTRTRRAIATRRNGLVAAALAMAAMAIPVPMSVLAPVEVVALKPFVVTAPFNGVVDEIVVDANSPVKVGDLLVQFNDIEARSRLAVAESEERLAQARQRQIQQGASLSGDMRRDMAIVRAELDLARTELVEAQRQFDLSQLRAEVDGVAVFASREEWQGRPVSTGERLLEIADPSQLELRIQVGVGDSVVLRDGATVRVFPDHDPFLAFPAQLQSAAYRAEPVGEGRLAYPANAAFDDVEGVQLGQQGTARISNGTVSLGFYLFRRPIASIRQWTGL